MCLRPPPLKDIADFLGGAMHRWGGHREVVRRELNRFDEGVTVKGLFFTTFVQTSGIKNFSVGLFVENASSSDFLQPGGSLFSGHCNHCKKIPLWWVSNQTGGYLETQSLLLLTWDVDRERKVRGGLLVSVLIERSGQTEPSKADRRDGELSLVENPTS